MRPPRGSDGGLSEASRLIQEGLQLLEQRTREVDVLVARAHERARAIVGVAERQAHDITAAAELRRLELEDQITSMEVELEATREELARLRQSARTPGADRVLSQTQPQPQPQPQTQAETQPQTQIQPRAQAIAPVAAAASQPASAAVDSSPSKPAARAAVVARGVSDSEDVAESAGSPRWGRPSSLTSAEQAMRNRPARPRWLPRWLPF